MPRHRRPARGPIFVVVTLVLLVAAAHPADAGAARAPTRRGSAPATTAQEGTTDWAKVSAGGFHTCGIRVSGRLYCWGRDDNGQLGDGGTNTDQPTPVEVAGGVTDWVAVSSGYAHTCARTGTGRLYCWGSDENGQLGDDEALADQGGPVEVIGGATDWRGLSAGYGHTCARKSTGRLYCWGDDLTGQVGDDATLADRHTPAEVAGGATDWAAVDGGGFHTCARKTTGQLFCWGADSSGGLGDGGANTDQPTPVGVAGGGTQWKVVTAGRLHTCARKANGRLFCWGQNVYGQLGDNGVPTAQSTPTQVAGGSTGWTTTAAGDRHSCARKATGRLFCWGGDVYGQVGDGGADTDRPTPVRIASNSTTWTTVSSSGYHTCARKSNGRLFCWGLDSDGQLGDGGANTDQPAPSQVG